MPYSHDEVVAAVTDYYHFLTRLHVDLKDIKTPPPGGWPNITSETLKLSLTDTAVSLLKHLPYITNEDNFCPTLVWWLSGCNDYTYHEFQTGHTGIPAEVELEDCQWDKLRGIESPPHFVHFACPAVSQRPISPTGGGHHALPPIQNTILIMYVGQIWRLHISRYVRWLDRYLESNYT